jgi:hypothetical protein
MKHMSKIGIVLFALAFVATASLAGCASAPLRTEESASGIRAAEAVGAADVPQAALHLQLAKEGQATAQGLAKKGEKEQAVSMLTRAEADAELAVVLSREDAEKTKTLAALERVRQLREEYK